jgi:hypothetical protein
MMAVECPVLVADDLTMTDVGYVLELHVFAAVFVVVK